PGALQGRGDRCRLAAPGPDVGQGVRVAVDLRSRARFEDALRQPRPRRGRDGSQRLRADLEPARVSAGPLASAPATARRLWRRSAAHPPSRVPLRGYALPPGPELSSGGARRAETTSEDARYRSRTTSTATHRVSR